MTTLSILVPHYDDPEGLALTLASIERQTWRGDREVIVVDDGSRAEARSRIDTIVAASRERVRLIVNDRNRGRPFTRNVLLEAADGDYVTWCDTGDEYAPRKLELQLAALARSHPAGGHVWSTCNVEISWTDRGARTSVTQRVEGDPIVNLFQGSLRAYLFTVVGTRRSFRDVGWFDLELPRLQDTDFFLRFVAKGGVIERVPEAEPLCTYHKTDVGRSAEEILACHRRLLRKHAALLMAQPRRFRRDRIFHQYQLAARFAARNHERLRAAVYLGASALENPIAFARWIVKRKGKL